MRLDLLDLVEGGERPDNDLAILRAGIDGVVLRTDCEGEDAAAMLEAVEQFWSGLLAVGHFKGRQNGRSRVDHERRHRG